jgi:hypothetical protein
MVPASSEFIVVFSSHTAPGDVTNSQSNNIFPKSYINGAATTAKISSQRICGNARFAGPYGNGLAFSPFNPVFL